jgi:hypothetical protein
VPADGILGFLSSRRFVLGLAFMRGSSRLSRAIEPGFGVGLCRALAVAVAMVVIVASSPARADALIAPAPAPPPAPVPIPTNINSDISAGAAVTNLGSNFLERLGNQATYGFGNALRNNPGGGGASQTTEDPRFRTWGEGYGISTTDGAQGTFVGDRRQTWGGVAGFGARLAPGVNVGFSVDQSRTSIDVPLAFQSATLDLTQLGFNASVDKGPWTWAIALVHGFGKIDSSRDTGFGLVRVASRSCGS